MGPSEERKVVLAFLRELPPILLEVKKIIDRRIVECSSNWDRLAEAQPLLRRSVQIFLASTRRAGYEHVHYRPAVRAYAGLMMKMAFSSCNLRRRSARACGPQFFRHIGNALSMIAENVLVTPL